MIIQFSTGGRGRDPAERGGPIKLFLGLLEPTEGTAEVLRRPKSLAYLQSLKWVAQVKDRIASPAG